MNCKPKVCAGDLRHGITIVRRSLESAAPGSAEPVLVYATVFTTRAAIKTKAGTTLWNRVEINGQKASHEMTIRWTSIAFDIRDRVRDAAGTLYQILSIDNVDERDDWFRLMCAKLGDDDKPSVT